MAGEGEDLVAISSVVQDVNKIPLCIIVKNKVKNILLCYHLIRDNKVYWTNLFKLTHDTLTLNVVD